MTITIRPDLERSLQERLSNGGYASADDLVNSLLERAIADDFAPGELDRLLEVGTAQAAAEQFVDAEGVARRLAELRGTAKGRQ